KLRESAPADAQGHNAISVPPHTARLRNRLDSRHRMKFRRATGQVAKQYWEKTSESAGYAPRFSTVCISSGSLQRFRVIPVHEWHASIGVSRRQIIDELTGTAGLLHLRLAQDPVHLRIRRSRPAGAPCQRSPNFPPG